MIAVKFMKKRGYTGTVRKIMNDDGNEVLGVVGTFKDLMEMGIVEKVTQYSFDTWCCIPGGSGRIECWTGIGSTREEAVKNTRFGKKMF